MEAKTVSESKVEIAQVMMPQHANPAGNIFGGEIMSIIDNAASIVAARHTRRNIVTASVDRIDFISPVFVGNVKASVNYVSRTSMEIGVKVDAECLITGTRAHVASAYLTFVALDENDTPTAITTLTLETEEDERRFREGKKRKEERVKSREKHDSLQPCIVRIKK